MRVAPFASLDPASYREIVRRALAEDVRWGDVTTEAVVPAELTATGVIVVSTSCVLAGLDVAMECFRQLDPQVELEAARREGERCESGTELARLRGGAAALLTAERTALNFLQRLCGISSMPARDGSPCSTPGRPCRPCAPWKSMPCGWRAE